MKKFHKGSVSSTLEYIGARRAVCEWAVGEGPATLTHQSSYLYHP